MCLTLVAPFPPPSAWVLGFLQDLWWVLLPGPRAPRYPCLFPPGHPRLLFLFFLSCHPRSFVCPFASSRSPAACSFCASSPPVVLRGLFLVFFLFTPFPAGHPALWFPPPCMHAHQLHRSSGHGFPRCSSPVQSPSWGVALGGPRPCQVGSPPSRLSHSSPLSPPLSSVSCPPSYCCSPALCALCWSSLRHGCISRALKLLRASALSPDV